MVAYLKSMWFSSIENVTGHGWQKLMRAKKFRYQIEQMLPVPPSFHFTGRCNA